MLIARSLADRRPEPVGPLLLRVLSPRIIVSPQLRQMLVSLPADPSPQRLDEFITTLSHYLWACLGAQALEVAGELDRVTGHALGLSPRDEVVLIDREEAAVEARRAAGRLAAKLGFGAVKRMKLMTAVSELARNIGMYAGRGEVRLGAHLPPGAAVQVEAVDEGPGIAELQAVLAGTYRSRSGLGLGLRGVQAVADAFSVESAPGQGTRVQALFYAMRPPISAAPVPPNTI
ncbi:MAG: hypothetical protein M9894_05190 [Planctomycetes bacterium]|nr:hypothetical protein [Planctomycetota bacterium]